MAAADSFSIVPVHYGSFSFRVRLCTIQREIKLSARVVCSTHGEEVTHVNVCQACNHPIAESTQGTPGPGPIKRRFCSNRKCGAKTGDNVKSLVFCGACCQVLKDGQFEKATLFQHELYRFTAEQRAALQALRLPGRGIHVKRGVPAAEAPSRRYIRSSHELRPGNTRYDKAAFQLMRYSARQQGLSFICHTGVKSSKESLAFEHGACLEFEKDGTVLLVLMYAQHEVQTDPAPEADLPAELKLMAVRLHQALVDPVNAVDWTDALSTPAVRGLHGLLLDQQAGRNEFQVPAPSQENPVVDEQARGLDEALKAYIKSLPRQSRKKDAPAEEGEGQAEDGATEASEEAGDEPASEDEDASQDEQASDEPAAVQTDAAAE